MEGIQLPVVGSHERFGTEKPNGPAFREADLETTTAKAVRRRLEAEYSVDLNVRGSDTFQSDIFSS